MRKYLSFLTHILMRKISLWVVAIIYALILASFSIIVPLLVNLPTINAWIIDAKVTLTAVLMVTAIFSAMIAIFIFREPQEDGTELLICSKPLERKKLILAKMLTYWIFLAFFSVIPILIFLIMFAFPQFSNMSTVWLLVGFLCGNLVSMFFFGGIAALFSLKFSKIVVIIANMAIVILMGIYGTVIVATTPTPLGQMLQSKKYAATVVPYIDKDNKTSSASYFLPATQDFEEMLKVASLDGQKEIWSNAVANSPINILNGFNFANQLSTVYLSGGLEEAWYNRQYSMGIGNSFNMNYQITDNVNYAGNDSYEEHNDWNDDNAELWSNIGKTNAPATWFDLRGVNRTTTYDFVKANNAILTEEDPIEVLATLIANIAALNFNYTVDAASTASAYTYGNAKYLNDVSKTESVDTYVAANFYDGQEVLSNRRDIDWQNLQPSEFEVSLFNYILYKLLFTSEYCDKITKPDEQWNIAFNNNVPDTWAFGVNNIGPSKSQPAINKIITTKFFNEHVVQEVLDLDTPEKIGWEITKFKYYAYLKLTGQAGKVIKAENESGVKDFIYESEILGDFAVPWDAYFKCVYNTQFNSLNVINMNEFGDTLGQKYLVSQGFIPINNFFDLEDTNSRNWLGFILDSDYEQRFDVDYGLNRLTPIYNGTEYKYGASGAKTPGTIGTTKYAEPEIFEAYDFTKQVSSGTTWDSYPKLTNKYGYISKLGLMTTSFLTDYVFSNFNQIYYGDEDTGSFVDEYKSKLYSSRTPYLVYSDMLFNYDATAQFPPGGYAAIYLALAVIMFGIAYARFVKYDFK